MWVIDQSFSSETCSKLTACSIGFTVRPAFDDSGLIADPALNTFLTGHGRENFCMG